MGESEVRKAGRRGLETGRPLGKVESYEAGFREPGSNPLTLTLSTAQWLEDALPELNLTWSEKPSW